MKKFYTLILALLLVVSSAGAQTIIYHENFSGTVTGVTGSSWTLSTANNSNHEQASGGANFSTSTTSASGFTNKTLALRNNISTIGFRNIKVSWSDYRSFVNNGHSGNNNSAPVKFFYRVGAGAYVEVTGFTQNPSYNQWNKINGGVEISLPAACNDVNDLNFYWTYNNNNDKGDFYAIDDITITGTPDDDPSTQETDLSVLNWGAVALNEDPFAAGKSYVVDENAVTFTKSVGAGVTLSKNVVSNTDFQSPTKSLALIQTGASRTSGSSIKMAFAAPVADLTFTIFDLDQASGQFQDQVVIKGKGLYGQEVLLTKKKVKTTFNNSFAEASSAVTGVSGSDVPATSAGGNLTVSFSEPVGEVTIQYYNLDSSRGNQGIGLHNLSWRRDRYVAPLPVELLFFKGIAQGANASLSWATAQEKNNEKFVVERSLDGKSFSQIGEVQGHGNSSIRLNYSFTDTNPAEGVNYYRLRQVDFDGTTETSKVVALQFKSMKQALGGNIAKVYPTLAASEVNVSLALANAQVRVLDAKGRQVAEYSNASQNLVVPVSHLQPGVYFVKVTNGSEQQTQRFIKQ
ncbi:T9SS type A sorting domain-containing protein [Pontibacter litorisediminis]|uniref:T9SS type A sorting domain-containing protein n=1 Tax=Pontibacter litorisediminis TaxID=1846260 RepID=UPI0023ED8806|nr:T9SS type A sorting domain-containing protein [Pontibacter litorisediminis]